MITSLPQPTTDGRGDLSNHGAKRSWFDKVKSPGVSVLSIYNVAADVLHVCLLTGRDAAIGYAVMVMS